MGKKKVPSRTVGDTPTPPITKRSLNPAIIDDNIAKLEKAIKAGDVTANPAGTSEETLLTSIGIDGKKYDIGASAENVSYDNTNSGLIADDTQGAIDELSNSISTIYGLTKVSGSVALGASLAAGSKTVKRSDIVAETGDTCTCYFSKDDYAICQPYISSTGYWACALYNQSTDAFASTDTIEFAVFRTIS